MKSLETILAPGTYAGFRDALVGSGCDRCPLAAGRTQIVPDRGNPGARLMFVGEAPGANEDLQGKAFVGRGGKLLDSLLAELGLNTDRDAIIVNICKCRPPENRRPKPDEVLACRPFLEKQVELVSPRFVGLLGATAVSGFFPEKKGLAMAGQVGAFFEDPSRPGAKFIALYHPAYILRDPRKKPLMKEHLKVLVDAWKTGT